MLLLLVALAAQAAEIDPTCHACEGYSCTQIGAQYSYGMLMDPGLNPALAGDVFQAEACFVRGCDQGDAAACQALDELQPRLMAERLSAEPEPEPEPAPAPAPEPRPEVAPTAPVLQVRSHWDPDAYLLVAGHLGFFVPVTLPGGGTALQLAASAWLQPVDRGVFIGVEAQLDLGSATIGRWAFSALRIAGRGERWVLSAGVGPGYHLGTTWTDKVGLHEVVEARFQTDDDHAWFGIGPRLEVVHFGIDGTGFSNTAVFLGGSLGLGFGHTY